MKENSNNVMYVLNQNLLCNNKVSSWVRLYVLLCIFYKNDRPIYALNGFFASRLDISIETVKKCLKRLKNAELIEIINSGTFKRTIIVKNNIFKDKIEKRKKFEKLFDYDWLNDNE